METPTKRIIWMDVLNVCACMSVLILHSNSAIIHQFDGVVDGRFIWGVFTHSFFYWPVPIFLMLSGSNLIGRHRGGYIKRRIDKALIPFIIWTMIYVVLFNYRDLGSIFTLKMLNVAINGLVGAGYMWFFIPLFAFYFSAPFLTILFKGSSVEDKRIFLLLSFIFVSVIPFLLSMMHLDGFRYNLFPMGTSFLVYPVLGWMICNDSWFEEHKKQLYIAGIISAIVHFAGLFITIGVLGWKSKFFQNTLYPTDFIMSTAVFLFFKNYNWQAFLSSFHISTKTLALLSSCSLGIYLIQNLIFVISGHCYNLCNNQYFGFLFTWFLGLLIVLILKHIPLLKRIVP